MKPKMRSDWPVLKRRGVARAALVATRECRQRRKYADWQKCSAPLRALYSLLHFGWQRVGAALPGGVLPLAEMPPLVKVPLFQK